MSDTPSVSYFRAALPLMSLSSFSRPALPKTKRYVSPSEPTIRRVLQQIDSRIADKVVGQWLLTRVCCNEGDVVAIDGKTLKGARIKNDRKLHLLSAFLRREGVVIAQQEVDIKSNEITAVQPMLENTDIQGMVVTADAMHTQIETARFIVEEKGADFFLQSRTTKPPLNPISKT